MKRLTLITMSCLLALVALAGLALSVRIEPASASSKSSTVLYVSADGDCGGMSTCYDVIQDAVDAASEGDTVKVAQGVYTSAGFQVVYINEAITLSGGYTNTDWTASYPLTQPTAIDAEGVERRRGMYVEQDVGMIQLGGLTIQRCYAKEGNGGGVYIPAGRVVIQDSRILSCTATGDSPNGYGGGVYVGEGTVVVRDSLFAGNGDAHRLTGGALAIRDGNVTVDGNVFRDNTGDHPGCAASLVGNGTMTLTHNDFRHNEMAVVSVRGGTASVFSNTFANNDRAAMVVGGGLATIRENIVAGNGGGLAVFGGEVTVAANRIVGNFDWAFYCENSCDGAVLVVITS